MEIKKFVQDFMKSRDFVPGVYQNGPHSFIAEPVLEDLLGEWEQSRQAAVSGSVCEHNEGVDSVGGIWFCTKCGESVAGGM